MDIEEKYNLKYGIYLSLSSPTMKNNQIKLCEDLEIKEKGKMENQKAEPKNIHFGHGKNDDVTIDNVYADRIIEKLSELKSKKYYNKKNLTVSYGFGCSNTIKTKMKEFGLKEDSNADLIIINLPSIEFPDEVTSKIIKSEDIKDNTIFAYRYSSSNKLSRLKIIKLKSHIKSLGFDYQITEYQDTVDTETYGPPYKVYTLIFHFTKDASKNKKRKNEKSSENDINKRFCFDL